MKPMQNLVYVGSYSTLQTTGKDTKAGYSLRQNELYNRLLFGLKVYTPEELYAMNSNKKNRITRAHKKAQNLINLYKQRVMINMTQALITLGNTDKIKPRSLFADTELDPTFHCTLSFKDLNIKKEDVINLFLANKLLPSDYLNAA
jgi:hypothetical protein